MNTPVVYLACPITKGNRNWNFFQSCEAQQLLMRKGYAVIAPGLSMLHPNAWNIPYEQWMQGCLPVVERCDLLIRLPGESEGADMEVEHAKKHGVDVHEIDFLEELEVIIDDRK